MATQQAALVAGCRAINYRLCIYRSGENKVDMKSTVDILQALKEKLGVATDYALAKRMGWTTQRVSNYRRGARQLDDLSCFQAAEVLGIDARKLIALSQSLGAKSPEDRETWRAILQRLGGFCHRGQQPGEHGGVAPGAASSEQGSDARGLCIMSTSRQRRQWRRATIGAGFFPSFA